MSAVVGKSHTVPILGFRLAVARLEEAAADPERPDEVYVALAEAGNWLDSLAPQMPKSSDVHGVTFARNRMHHQWGSTTYVADGLWVWRPASQLPLPSDPRDNNEMLRRCYVRHLEGKPVVDVFRRLTKAISGVQPR